MEARFTPGSLVSWLLFLSWCQLCVKTPSVTTVSQHFGRMVAFCTLASPKMLCLAGPPCKNYHNLGIFLKEGSSTRANLEGLGYGSVLDACLTCTRSWIQSQQYRPIGKKIPRHKEEQIWKASGDPLCYPSGQNKVPKVRTTHPQTNRGSQGPPTSRSTSLNYFSLRYIFLAGVKMNLLAHWVRCVSINWE